MWIYIADKCTKLKKSSEELHLARLHSRSRSLRRGGRRGVFKFITAPIPLIDGHSGGRVVNLFATINLRPVGLSPICICALAPNSPAAARIHWSLGCCMCSLSFYSLCSLCMIWRSFSNSHQRRLRLSGGLISFRSRGLSGLRHFIVNAITNFCARKMMHTAQWIIKFFMGEYIIYVDVVDWLYWVVNCIKNW